MKKYLVQYRPFLVFLSKFFLTYLVLGLIYQAYLSGYDDRTIDGISTLVAKNTEQLLSLFQADFYIEKQAEAPYILMYYKQKVIARMIEGCNAVSVINLFVSFIVAFSGKLKPTLLFIFGGSLIIYILNVIRLALLNVMLYSFPSQKELLHDILFPLFIYGAVFMLWMIWINRFSKYAKNNPRT